MSKTHWKQLHNPDYIGAYSLPDGKDIVVTIESVSKELVTSNGGKKEECTVAKLKGQKPMILNVTNCRTIANIYNSPYVEDWIGKSITLFVSTASLKGEQVECLRIRPNKPIDVNDLNELFELKQDALSEVEKKRAIDIISKQEVNSYEKLYNILKSK